MKSNIEIRAWLTARIAAAANLPPEQVAQNEPLASYGLSSRDAAGLSGDLEKWLGLELSPTLVFEYPTIDELAEFLSRDNVQT